MPIVLSRCQGGIWRALTRDAIDCAQGRASWYVTSDIGAIELGRWHDSHFSWKIGAMSFVKVVVFGVSAASAAAGTRRNATARFRTFIVIARSVSTRPPAGDVRCRDERSVYHFWKKPTGRSVRTHVGRLP